MIIPQTNEELINQDVGQLWKIYNLLLEETAEDNKILKEHYTKETTQIKDGIKLKIPIWYIINEWYDIYPNNGKIQIQGHGKHNLITFMEEKDEREKIMRKIISEQMEEESNTEARN